MMASRGDPEVAGRDAFPETGPTGARSPGRLLRTAALFYGLLMLVPLGWRAARGGPSLFHPGGFSLADTVAGLGLGLLAGLGVVALSGLTMRRTAWGRRLADTFARILGPLPGSHAWALALLSGFGEEMFFRGMLQPALGLVITSLLFGLVHFIPRREILPWTCFSIGAGFLLGWLFQFSGTLVAPIACHVLVNGINLDRITHGPRV